MDVPVAMEQDDDKKRKRRKNMKKIISLILALMLIFLVSAQLLSCDSDKSNSKNEYNVTVHYYDDITRSYTVYNRGKLEGEILAPSGHIIIGLFDESGVQYAMSDCVVDSWNANIPTTLYAKYEKVEKTSYTLGEIGWDEQPKTVSFYQGIKTTWDLNTGDTTEAKIIEICECNPYADLTITVKFMGKGVNSQKYTPNKFKYKVLVNDEAIGNFASENLGSSYTEHTVTATIKAKQLMNAGYEIIATASSSLGYEDYTVKNFVITLSFNFD